MDRATRKERLGQAVSSWSALEWTHARARLARTHASAHRLSLRARARVALTLTRARSCRRRCCPRRRRLGSGTGRGRGAGAGGRSGRRGWMTTCSRTTTPATSTRSRKRLGQAGRTGQSDPVRATRTERLGQSDSDRATRTATRIERLGQSDSDRATRTEYNITYIHLVVEVGHRPLHPPPR